MDPELNGRKGVMVCVTGQRSCERLIVHGVKRSEPDENGVRPPLFIVHCVLNGQKFMNSIDEADAIDYLFTCAQYAGAEPCRFRSRARRWRDNTRRAGRAGRAQRQIRQRPSRASAGY